MHPCPSAPVEPYRGVVIVADLYSYSLRDDGVSPFRPRIRLAASGTVSLGTNEELVPVHKILKPSSTCFKARKWNVHVPSDSDCFNADHFCQHQVAVASGSANVNDKVLFKFWKLALLPMKSLSGLGGLAELLRL